MKILWLDLNSSYAHSSLALPALHAQMATNDSFEWEIVSATINENVGMVTNSIYHHHPDIIAATNWLFNHEQLLHILSRAKALLPYCRIALGGPEFLGDNEDFLRKNPLSIVYSGEKVKKYFLNGYNIKINRNNGIQSLDYATSTRKICITTTVLPV